MNLLWVAREGIKTVALELQGQKWLQGKMRDCERNRDGRGVSYFLIRRGYDSNYTKTKVQPR